MWIKNRFDNIAYHNYLTFQGRGWNKENDLKKTDPKIDPSIIQL